MTVEAVTYISDLNASYPASGDSLVEGDDHIRNLKTGIKATFQNISGAVTPTHTELNYVDGVTSAIQTQLDAKAALTERGLILIATASASTSASIDFTSGITSTYDEYELHIINAISAGTGVPWLRTSANAGGAWDSGSGDYDYLYQQGTGTASSVVNSSTTATKIILMTQATSSFDNTGGFSAIVKFFDPAGTASNKRFHWNAYTGASSAGGGTVAHGGGSRFATAAINGVQFLFSTGNITSGKFKLYGVKKS